MYQKRLPNDLTSIVQQLSVYQSRMEGIVVESTYNWHWLVDGLMEQGHRVHLAKLLIGQMTAEVSAHETVKFRLVRRNRRAYETFKS